MRHLEILAQAKLGDTVTTQNGQKYKIVTAAEYGSSCVGTEDRLYGLGTYPGSKQLWTATYPGEASPGYLLASIEKQQYPIGTILREKTFNKTFDWEVVTKAWLLEHYKDRLAIAKAIDPYLNRQFVYNKAENAWGTVEDLGDLEEFEVVSINNPTPTERLAEIVRPAPAPVAPPLPRHVSDPHGALLEVTQAMLAYHAAAEKDALKAAKALMEILK